MSEGRKHAESKNFIAIKNYDGKKKSEILNLEKEIVINKKKRKYDILLSS